MEKYKMILFDLDGTLSDPKIGITKSVQYGLENMGIFEPDLQKLECFIGPPLQDSFAEYYHMNENDILKAIDYYRERFKEKGMFENELYPGIQAMLESLKQAGHKLIIATSKPTVFSEQILKYFAIDRYFDQVVGSNLDGTRSSKTDIIDYIINLYRNYDQNDFVMIGDRKHDLIGAHNTGIDCIGVTYGYGSIDEIKGASPTYMVGSVEELKQILGNESK